MLLGLRKSLIPALLCALAIGLASSSAPLYAQGKGKPGGGGGGTTLPPVRYQVKTFRMPAHSVGSVSTHQMTNTGIVVGYYTTTDNARHPFLYDPSDNPDVAIDLNDLDISWHAPGWRLASALGVNELGYVVGQMEEIANPGLWHGYVLDLNASPAFLVPLSTGPALNYTRRINDNLDIVGVTATEGGGYKVNLYNLASNQYAELGSVATHQVELSNPPPGQPAQVVGTLWKSWSLFRYTVGGGFDNSMSQFQGNAWAINPNGVFCGQYDKYNKSGNITASYAYRYENSLQTFTDIPNRGASAINSHKDFVTWNNQKLYHEGAGLLDLNSLIVGSTSDVAIWNGSGAKCLPDMTERGALNPGMPNYPGMCAWLYGPEYGHRGALLIPVAP